MSAPGRRGAVPRLHAGVAEDCRAIAEDPAAVRRLTVRGNSVAVVSDGSAVLGLGDIGPRAALPVLDGKAALYQRWLAGHTQPGSGGTGLGQALDGADVFIGVSTAGVLGEQDVTRMANGAIVFALANPDPEIDPDIARRHAAVVATGRSDQPNQINNVLAFPGIVRGLLDGAATELTVAA